MSRKKGAREAAGETGFRGYEGHTIRHQPHRTTQPPIVIRLGSYIKPDRSGVSTIPITEVDQYFDDGFSFCVNGYNASNGRPLNDEVKWTNVEQCLRENSVSVRNSYNRGARRASRIFEMPVLGHRIVKDEVEELRQQFWLLWKGRYYDPNVIHIERGWKLTPLCPLRTPRDPEPNLRESIDGTELLLRSEYSQLDEARRCPKGRKRLWNGRIFHEVDLGAVVNIQLLVVLGGYPRRMNTFPCIRYEGKDIDADTLAELRALDADRKYNWRRRVYTVRPEDLGWTTLFDMYYRDLATGKWHLYKENMEGNVDTVGERVHHVDILARSLRIVPKEWHQFAEIRCRFYGSRQPFGQGGRALRKASESVESGHFSSARPDTSASSVAGGMEVVEYELLEADAGGMVLDGTQWNYRSYYDWNVVSKRAAKNSQWRSLQSDLKELRLEDV